MEVASNKYYTLKWAQKEREKGQEHLKKNPKQVFKCSCGTPWNVVDTKCTMQQPSKHRKKKICAAVNVFLLSSYTSTDKKVHNPSYHGEQLPIQPPHTLLPPTV